MDLYHCEFKAPFSTLLIIWDKDEYLLYLGLNEDVKYGKSRLEKLWNKSINLRPSHIPNSINSALLAYFEGDISAIDDLKVKVMGTDFQLKAWEVLRTIKGGQTISYQEEAKRAGNIKAVRAIGGANNKNPIAIVIPCHRVIGKDGSMVGYGGGLDIKNWLLAHEKSHNA